MFPETRLRFHTTTSTNDQGRAWAMASIGRSALVTASHQTAGRGRRGAAWSDQAGRSALMTYVVESPLPSAQAWKLSFVASLAAQRACSSVSGAHVAIKWPNDLVFDGRKLGGVLIEAVPLPGNRWAALLGIGINIGTPSPESSKGFALPATSLGEISGRDLIEAESVIECMSLELQPLLGQCGSARGWRTLVKDWRKSAVLGGQQRGIDENGRQVSGVLEDIDVETGNAKLRQADGGLVLTRAVL